MTPSQPRLRAAALVLVLGAVAAAPAGATLLVNGSFETGTDPGSAYTILAPGSGAISGWSVMSTDIKYVGGAWTAAQGTRSIALNGDAPGGIAQTFASLPRAQYTVRFYMAGDPGSTPTLKTLRVAAAGQSADFSADITGMWAWDPGWNWHAWTFTADSTATTLEFHSLMSGGTGPTLDSVSVEVSSTTDAPAPLPATLSLAPIAPNPARGGSRVDYALPRELPVRVSVVDLAGREVAVLASGVEPAGRHSVAWDGSRGGARAAPGLYLVVLSAPGERRTQRLMLLR